eukprot:Hpha_TRINITY_DN15416_c1_g4::TRINITY_DN15416_c1_g4_i1::g.176953::m.176953
MADRRSSNSIPSTGTGGSPIPGMPPSASPLYGSPAVPSSLGGFPGGHSPVPSSSPLVPFQTSKPSFTSAATAGRADSGGHYPGVGGHYPGPPAYKSISAAGVGRVSSVDMMPLRQASYTSTDGLDRIAIHNAELEERYADAQAAAAAKDGEKKKDGPPWKIMLFTANLLIGLTVSQVAEHNFVFAEIVSLSTMFCLSFIMIGVGYEFEIDKSKLGAYAKDAGVAMGAAAIPWLLGAMWFMFALPEPLPFKEALAVAIFSAPTSAGILFSMLEAAGLKQTWLFQKARVLAIFDDLGTILLLIPIKALLVGPQWELSIIMLLIVAFLAVGWFKLHVIQTPCTWNWTLFYAFIVTAFCELLHFVTQDHIPMEAVHLEVLLPAFTFGVIVLHQHQPAREAIPGSCVCAQGDKVEDKVGTFMSAVFMIFVGLSMPRLEIFGGTVGSGSGSEGSGSEEKASMSIGPLLGHVVGMTLLMILGKFVPFFFYRTEATNRERFALCLGMCPRGEVGAGVIVVALGLGIRGDSVTIAVMCLALNLVLSGFFIMAVKRLLKKTTEPVGEYSAPISFPPQYPSDYNSPILDVPPLPPQHQLPPPHPPAAGQAVHPLKNHSDRSSQTKKPVRKHSLLMPSGGRTTPPAGVSSLLPLPKEPTSNIGRGAAEPDEPKSLNSSDFSLGRSVQALPLLQRRNSADVAPSVTLSKKKRRESQVPSPPPDALAPPHRGRHRASTSKMDL